MSRPSLPTLLFWIAFAASAATTPAFTAMNSNALPSFTAVVEAGARLDIRDANGRAPLTRAIVWRRWGEVRLRVGRDVPPPGSRR